MLPLVVYVILALVFAVFVALFAVQNAGQITVTSWHGSGHIGGGGDSIAAALGAAFMASWPWSGDSAEAETAGGPGAVRRLEASWMKPKEQRRITGTAGRCGFGEGTVLGRALR